jgi:TetR/AcrR family transcriptional regulator, biofilm operon repressor
MRQTNTKERILDCAIDLFSKKGYKEVSVREIAGAVGIRAASLYKHYENKEAILETIFMLFRKMMAGTHQYEEEMLHMPEGMSAEEILTGSFLLFKDLIYNPRLLKITRIINMEQSHNELVKAFFLQELIDKPIEELTNTFEGMIAAGQLRPVDPRMLANTYHAYIISEYYTNNILRAEVDLPQVEVEMLAFIRFFCEEFGQG